MRSTSRRRARLITFSGIDGAGKSTQIQALRTSLSKCGFRVQVIEFWDRIACLTQLREKTGHAVFGGERGVGTPAAPVDRRDKNIRSFPMTCLRIALYVLDALSTRKVVLQATSADVEFILCDRYIHDELANLDLRNPFLRAYAQIILKMVPAPSVSYILDADPHDARARKPEYPLDFIRINRQSYLDLCRLVDGCEVIPPQDAESVHHRILNKALDLLSNGRNAGAAECEAAATKGTRTGEFAS